MASPKLLYPAPRLLKICFLYFRLYLTSKSSRETHTTGLLGFVSIFEG